MKRFSQSIGIFIAFIFFLHFSPVFSAQEASASPSMLDHVPADTPYLFSCLEPIPVENMESCLQLADVSWKAARQAMEDALYSASKPTRSQKGSFSQSARFFIALADSIGEDLSKEDLARFGFSESPRFILYGIGYLPVLRWELKDPEVFKATLAKLEKESGAKLPQKQLGTQSYWGFDEDGGSVVVALRGKELIFAAGPTKELSANLPLVFGEKKPSATLSKESLEKCVKDYQLLSYSFGYVDIQRLLDRLLTESDDVGPERKKEILGFVSNTPRLVFGLREWSKKAMEVVYLLETTPELAAQISSLAVALPKPPAELEGKSLMSFGVGVDLQKACNFLKEKTEGLYARAKAGKELSLVETALWPLAQGVRQPLPPFLSSLKGAQVWIRELGANFIQPDKLRAVAVIQHDNPAQLVEALKGFAPPLKNWKIEANGKPTNFPPGAMPRNAEQAQAAILGSRLWLCLGNDLCGELPKWMKSANDSEPALLTLSMDYGRYFEMTQETLTMMKPRPGTPDSESYYQGQALALKMMKAYERVTFSLHGAKQGLLIKARATFK